MRPDLTEYRIGSRLHPEYLSVTCHAKIRSTPEINMLPSDQTVTLFDMAILFAAEFVKGMCQMYGSLMEMRLFQDKGYAFIRYAGRESAASAILGINNSEIHGHHVRCSWGKETRDPHILKVPLLLHCSLPASARDANDIAG